MGWSNSNLPWAEFERRLSGREPILVDPVTIDYGDGSDTPAHTRKRERYQAPPDVVRGESTVDYVELHCHTNFSFLDGASQPKVLVEEAVKLGLLRCDPGKQIFHRKSRCSGDTRLAS